MSTSTTLNERIIEPEWLDRMPAADARAVRARADLRRVNAWMANARLVATALRHTVLRGPPRRVVELGAGDGTFLLAVARRLATEWGQVEAVLVDRQPVVTAQTASGFHRLGWSVQVVRADVFDWLLSDPNERADVVLANLFLHHFSEAGLRCMFETAARKTGLLVACEPERCWRSLAGAMFLGLAGCSVVTCHDAVISVRAGFRAQELSKLWIGEGNWDLREESSGMFSHIFTARQRRR